MKSEEEIIEAIESLKFDIKRLKAARQDMGSKASPLYLEVSNSIHDKFIELNAYAWVLGEDENDPQYI